MKNPIVFDATVEDCVVVHGIGSMRSPVAFLSVTHPVVEKIKFSGAPTVRMGDRIRVHVDPSRVGSRNNRPIRVEDLPTLLSDGLISVGPVFRIDILSADGSACATHLTIDGWRSERRDLIDEFYG